MLRRMSHIQWGPLPLCNFCDFSQEFWPPAFKQHSNTVQSALSLGMINFTFVLGFISSEHYQHVLILVNITEVTKPIVEGKKKKFKHTSLPRQNDWLSRPFIASESTWCPIIRLIMSDCGVTQMKSWNHQSQYPVTAFLLVTLFVYLTKSQQSQFYPLFHQLYIIV